MKNITVILCYSKQNTIWAVNYVKKNSYEKVIILTPTIEGQLTLRDADIPHLLWYEIEEYEQQYLTKSSNEPHQKSLQVTNFFEKKLLLNSRNFYNINIFLLLKDGIKSIFNDIIHNYIIYKKIIKKWKPEKIYIPVIDKKSYKTGDGDFFSLAFYIQHYFKSAQTLILLYREKPKSKNYISILVSDFKKIIKFVKDSIQKYYFSVVTFRSPIKKKDFKKYVLMETGGIITSYYYDFCKLINQGHNLLLITYKLQLSQQIPLIKRSIQYQDLNSLWNYNDNDLLVAENNYIIRQLSNITKINSHRYISWVTKELNVAFVDQANFFLKSNIKITLKKIIINFNLLKKYKPSIVINSHDPSPTGLSLVFPAKTLSIPSALLLHGLPIGKYHAKTYSDYLVTWGKKTQESFKKYTKLQKNRILSSGLPIIDRYITSYKQIGNRNLKKVTIPKLKLGILVTNYHPNDSYIAKFLLDLASAFKIAGVSITINYRLHEGYNIPGIDLLEKDSGCKFNNQSSENIDDFINNNDIILSFDTTAILWPMLFKKPLFYTSPLWGRGSLPVHKYKAAWIPNNPQKLVDKIKQYVENPEIYKELLIGQRKFLEDFAGPIDGKSSTRLVNIIDQLIINNDR